MRLTELEKLEKSSRVREKLEEWESEEFTALLQVASAEEMGLGEFRNQ